MPKENNIPLTSPDMQKELIQKLKAIYPPLFSDEGKLNKQELEALVKNFDGSDTSKYEFRWAGKMQSKRHAFAPSKARLKPDAKRSVNFDKTENIIIEGENLEVLKLLIKSYYNQIKCVYIDPPYNIDGDRLYADDYTDDQKAYWEQNGTYKDGVKIDTSSETGGRYHSNWLDMMQSRLLVASQLLKDDGVIFVSIDDREAHNLRKLMDEVFGEENFLGILKRRASRKSANLSKTMGDICDYVVVYAKDQAQAPLLSIENIKDTTRPVLNAGNKKTVRTIPKGTVARCGDGTYSAGLYKAKSVEFELLNDLVIEKGITTKAVDVNGPFRVNQDIFTKTVYITEHVSLRRHVLPEELEDAKIINDLVDDPIFYNEKGTEELIQIFGVPIFDNPKPSALIKRLVKSVSRDDSDCLVLDFFAGSGTTGHAVMDLNKEDDGKRKFILVQLPETTDQKSEAYKAGFKAISEITIERNKRVGKIIKSEKEGVDTGFKAFVLTKSIFPENNFSPDPTKTEKENIKALEGHIARAKSQLQIDIKGKENDLMFEILLKDGFALNFTEEHLKEFKDNAVIKINDGSKTALICLDQNLKAETIKAIAPYKETRFICLHRAVDTTKKWELTKLFGNDLLAFV